MHHRRRALRCTAAAVTALALLVGGPVVGAQDAPDLSGSDTAPTGATDVKGDGAPAPKGGIAVPPEAQAIIDAVPRTGPSSTKALLEALEPVRALGVPEEEIYRVGFGRFPIAGEARYGHDWLYPRYGPGFRFHLGTDVFAAYGTPVRAPVDGIVRSSSNSLGGLAVKVIMEDGTYFYLAHLSGLPEGFTDGMPVQTGDIVGYVGDSGNAKGGAPHLHIGIYPRGGDPVDPKPILDGFLQEAIDRVPAVLEVARAAGYDGTPPEGGADPSTPTTPSPMVLRRASWQRTALRLFRDGGVLLPAEVLYATGANPLGGADAMLRLAVDELVASIDWAADEDDPAGDGAG